MKRKWGSWIAAMAMLLIIMGFSQSTQAEVTGNVELDESIRQIVEQKLAGGEASISIRNRASGELLYDYNGETITEYPANLEIIEQCKPIYEELPGWSEDVTGIRNFEDLPQNAQNYVNRIVELTGIQLMTFSVGPAREQTNIVNAIWQ